MTRSLGAPSPKLEAAIMMSDRQASLTVLLLVTQLVSWYTMDSTRGPSFPIVRLQMAPMLITITITTADECSLPTERQRSASSCCDSIFDCDGPDE